MTNGEWQATERFLFEKQTFNEHSSLATKARYLSDRKLTFRERYNYVNDLLASRYFIDSNQVTNWHVELTYNNKDQLIQRIYFDPNGNYRSEENLSYNAQGQLIDVIHIDIDDVIILQERFSYDAVGFIDTLELRNADDSLREKQENTYEKTFLVSRKVWFEGVSSELFYSYEADRLIRKSFYSSEGELLKKWVFSYNDSGHLSSVTQFIGDAIPERTVSFNYQ